MEPISRHLFINVVDLLPQVECVQKRGERPEVQRGGAGAKQVIADPRQLGDDDANVLAARRQLDVEQLLDGVVPSHLVHGRADVVLAVDNRDVLVEIEVFPQFLEPGMEIADVGYGIHDPLAVELEDQPERGVRRRMLRPEVQRPGGLLRLGHGLGWVEQFGCHPISLVNFAVPLMIRPGRAVENCAVRRVRAADSLSGADKR